MNRQNAIRIAKEHLKKYEGFSSKSPDKNIPYSTILPIYDDAIAYAYPDGKGYSIGWGTYDRLSDGTKVSKGFSINKKRADYELDLKLSKIDKNKGAVKTTEYEKREYKSMSTFLAIVSSLCRSGTGRKIFHQSL